MRGSRSPEFTLLVFDRWGELIYESNDEENEWDGKFRGNLAEIGVYTVQLEYKYFNNKATSYFTDLTLIR